jgi:hypothetical protein
VILAIDPGPKESAYVVLNKDLKPIRFGKVSNEELLSDLRMDIHQRIADFSIDHFAIEMVAFYGMSVGKEVFDTVFWIGRFWQVMEEYTRAFVYRKDVKVNLCGTVRAKDTNIRQALIDRFGPVGNKSNKGWFYGVKADIWSAIAVGVTYADKRRALT